MSAEIPGGYTVSLPADVDMSNDDQWLYTAVTIGPAANTTGYGQGGAVFTGYATAANFVGLLYTNGIVGETVGAYQRGSLKCRCQTAWTVGQGLTVGTNGKLKPAASGDTVIGKALFNAEPGDISTVLI